MCRSGAWEGREAARSPEKAGRERPAHPAAALALSPAPRVQLRQSPGVQRKGPEQGLRKQDPEHISVGSVESYWTRGQEQPEEAPGSASFMLAPVHTCARAHTHSSHPPLETRQGSGTPGQPDQSLWGEPSSTGSLPDCSGPPSPGHHSSPALSTTTYVHTCLFLQGRQSPDPTSC